LFAADYNASVGILLAERVLPSLQVLQLAQGDITEEKTGAVVNAANAQLVHGAGVAGALLERGGHIIQQQSDAWLRDHGPVSHARPAWTTGGKLPAKFVIHAVGPVWGEGDEDVKLAAAVRGSLEVADQLKVESISFPAISTGIFGFPKDQAAHIIFKTVDDYFRTERSGVRLVRIVVLDHITVNAFVSAWELEGW
jgi:O-acetyl-ADP-ribose deacetylase (regulator of RNase III)